MKMYNLFLKLLLSLVLTSCENEEDNTDTNHTLPIYASFEKLYPTGNLVGESGEFGNAVWNQNTLKFYNSSNSDGISWIEFHNLNITGVGQYQLLYTPHAKAKFEAVYSTDVSPNFWINQGVNYNQGGIINITNYSNNKIDGNYNFTAWYYSNTLNREVGWGASGTFENIPINN